MLQAWENGSGTAALLEQEEFAYFSGDFCQLLQFTSLCLIIWAKYYASSRLLQVLSLVLLLLCSLGTHRLRLWGLHGLYLQDENGPQARLQGRAGL